MLTVDNRQLQYRLDKLEADYRQESDKVKHRAIFFPKKSYSAPPPLPSLSTVIFFPQLGTYRTDWGKIFLFSL